MPEDKPGTGDAAAETDDIEILYLGPDTGDAEEAPEQGLAPVAQPEAEGEIQRLKAEVEQYRDLYLRKLADFDNFRKRLERDREEMRRTAGEGFLRDLVPVLDNFERALMTAEDADPAAFRLGVTMISRQLWDALHRQGTERLDPQGQPFEPLYHEAVQRVEGSDREPGTVVSVLAKGYLFGGRLVRPALVAVAVPPPDAAVGVTGNTRQGGEGEQGS
jgi:molecular chaperone GrpE